MDGSSRGYRHGHFGGSAAAIPTGAAVADERFLDDWAIPVTNNFSVFDFVKRCVGVLQYMYVRSGGGVLLDAGEVEGSAEFENERPGARCFLSPNFAYGEPASDTPANVVPLEPLEGCVELKGGFCGKRKRQD